MLSINSGSAVPVYEQLKRQIRLGIVSGRYRQGYRMPSIRDLAAKLKVNPNTIAKVYCQLEADAFLVSKAGSGFFVEHSTEKLKQIRDELLCELAEEFIASAVELGASPEVIKNTVQKRLEGNTNHDKA
jgi:GntR family transcriptional regulator